MLIIKLLILVLLIWVFLQDLKYRAVYWFLFPLLASLFILTNLLQHLSYSSIAANTAVNAGFLLLQLLLISGYFSLKYRRWTNITRDLLGWGDILLLLSIAFYFPPLNFLAFYLGSLALILVILTIWKIVDRQFKQIPLAGLQAAILAVLLVFCWIHPEIDPTDDHWLYQILLKI